MKNVVTRVDGDKLHITVDLSENHGLSKSQKNVIIATSEGNREVPGANVIMGLNVYKRR